MQSDSKKFNTNIHKKRLLCQIIRLAWDNFTKLELEINVYFASCQSAIGTKINNQQIQPVIPMRSSRAQVQGESVDGEEETAEAILYFNV